MQDCNQNFDSLILSCHKAEPSHSSEFQGWKKNVQNQNQPVKRNVRQFDTALKDLIVAHANLFQARIIRNQKRFLSVLQGTYFILCDKAYYIRVA